MQGVRILIVEDHHSLRKMIQTFLSQQEGIAFVGEASNGMEALKLLQNQPFDIMITDLVMPMMDGFTLMDEMGRLQLSPAPKVIVTSALSRSDFIQRAMRLGAGFYLLKPFQPESLVCHIRELMEQHERIAQPAARRHGLDERLSALFLSMGIPGHIKGYQYLRTGVKLVMENAECLSHITKKLYPGIAERFDTSPSRVDRAIRHAIEVAWSRGRPDSLNRAFGCRVCAKQDKPSNGEFIAMVAEHMSMQA